MLINASDNPILCDFGLSRIRHEVTRTRTMIHEGGRLRFLAPELSNGISTNFRTSQASDIFALAMTFLNVWSREPPFSEIRNEVKVAANVRKGRRPKRPGRELDIAAAEGEFWALLAVMWVEEPLDRPSSEAVRNNLENIFPPILSVPLAPTRSPQTGRPSRPVLSLKIPSPVTSL